MVSVIGSLFALAFDWSKNALSVETGGPDLLTSRHNSERSHEFRRRFLPSSCQFSQSGSEDAVPVYALLIVVGQVWVIYFQLWLLLVAALRGEPRRSATRVLSTNRPTERANNG